MQLLLRATPSWHDDKMRPETKKRMRSAQRSTPRRRDSTMLHRLAEHLGSRLHSLTREPRDGSVAALRRNFHQRVRCAQRCWFRLKRSNLRREGATSKHDNLATVTCSDAADCPPRGCLTARQGWTWPSRAVIRNNPSLDYRRPQVKWFQPSAWPDPHPME